MKTHELIATIKVKAASAEQARKRAKFLLKELQTEDEILGSDGIGFKLVEVATVQ